MGQLGQLVLSDNTSKATPTTTTTTTSGQSLEVNSVQTTKSSHPPGNKKKNNNNRRKKNTSTKQTEQTNPESNAGGNKGRHKFKYPCIVCQEDHMTKDCPRLPNIQNYVKQGQPSSQPALLTNNFSTLEQNGCSSYFPSIW